MTILTRYWIEFVVAFFATSLSSLLAWWLYTNNLLTVLADQIAHLIFARLTIDSVTPGITQLGSWPPLLHVLMAPVTAFDFLFRSGLAGFVILLPIFVVGTVYLYRLVLRLTHQRFFALIAVLIYLLNPYVLYYSATPMMEVLLLSVSFALAFHFVRWLQEYRLYDLIIAGGLVSVAAVSRYEGLLLLPVVGVLTLATLLLRREGYHKIEALALIFGIPAAAGVAYLVIYSWIFVGHPLGFAGVGSDTQWVVSTITPEGFIAPPAWKALLHASFYMMSQSIVYVGLVCGVLTLVISRKRFELFAALAILVLPLIAVGLNMLRWENSVVVPEFSPWNDFHNVRYALTWIGFIAVATATFLATAYTFNRTLVYRILILTVTGLIISASVFFFFLVIFVERYAVIQADRSASKRTDTSDIVRYLKFNAQNGGFILSTRFNNDVYFLDSGLPLRSFIYEGNYRYFDRVLESPWLYAEWVVMTRPGTISQQQFFDPVTKLWAYDERFHRYYRLIASDEETDLYELDKASIINDHTEYGQELLNTAVIRSDRVIWSSEELQLLTKS